MYCENCGEAGAIMLTVVPGPIGRGRRKVVPVSREPYTLCSGCYKTGPPLAERKKKLDQAKPKKEKRTSHYDALDPLL